jgi:hypothetical protein
LSTFGIVIAFTWKGAEDCVGGDGISADGATARFAFRMIDVRLEQAATTLALRHGAFLTITLPLAFPGIVAEACCVLAQPGGSPERWRSGGHRETERCCSRSAAYERAERRRAGHLRCCDSARGLCTGDQPLDHRGPSDCSVTPAAGRSCCNWMSNSGARLELVARTRIGTALLDMRSSGMRQGTRRAVGGLLRPHRGTLLSGDQVPCDVAQGVGAVVAVLRHGVSGRQLFLHTSVRSNLLYGYALEPAELTSISGGGALMESRRCSTGGPHYWWRASARRAGSRAAVLPRLLLLDEPLSLTTG